MFGGGPIQTANQTVFCGPSYSTQGGAPCTNNAANAALPMVAGTLSGLKFNVSTAPGDSGSWEATVLVDGTATLSCTISGASQSCEDPDSTVIPPGALVVVEVDPEGSPVDPVNVAYALVMTPA